MIYIGPINYRPDIGEIYIVRYLSLFVKVQQQKKKKRKKPVSFNTTNLIKAVEYESSISAHYISASLTLRCALTASYELLFKIQYS